MDSATSQNVPTNSAGLGIPDGYVVVLLKDGKRCILPEYMVPATHQAFEGYWKRAEMAVRNENGGVSCIEPEPNGP